MHLADEIRKSKSNKLENKRIVLAVTGSIAAVESIKLARELIRHGAEIIPVMTRSATKIIHPDSLWFSTGLKPIIELTGDTEHVKYCGKVKDPVDLLLISPCTANTISKINFGIDDTVVTTFATTAIGSKIPIMIVPAMHISMYDHKIIQQNIKKLKDLNIEFIDPLLESNKAKMASIEEIIANVIRRIGKNDLKNKSVLIIGGSTQEPIDSVRSICNKSSGKTAKALSNEAFYRGASVELWYGNSIEKIPDYISNTKFSTLNDLKLLINKYDLSKYDIIIVCAALSDFIPEKINGKISSNKKELKITLKQAEKIIPLIKKKSKKAKIIGFKLETEGKKSINKATELLIKNNLDLVIANTTQTINNENTKAWIIQKNKVNKTFKGNKTQLTNTIYDTIIKK
jgi:phosphopantothenoylcysteine decarboxylase/phosphopantothenate--cysteine ligase